MCSSDLIFAFTVKGWGLPIAGHPMNHSALLSTEQVGELRAVLADPDDEWAGFAPDSPEGRLCAASAERLSEQHVAPAERVDPYAIPHEFGPVTTRRVSSQDAFARFLQDIANVEEVANSIVTTSPDVSISTGLGGWINKRGVFSPVVEEVFEIVKDLNSKERVTFLLAEQNTNIALRYADYGYILENGRVVMDGEAKALRENEDVKEFYLGMGGGDRKSFKDVKSYKRRKRWLA